MYREANAGWLRKSGFVALRVMAVLDEKKMTQTDLAEKMGVSRQQISKIVKGHENLTFETIDKLEKALDIKLITIAGEPKLKPEKKARPAKTPPASPRVRKETSPATRKKKTKATVS